LESNCRDLSYWEKKKCSKHWFGQWSQGETRDAISPNSCEPNGPTSGWLL